MIFKKGDLVRDRIIDPYSSVTYGLVHSMDKDGERVWGEWFATEEDLREAAKYKVPSKRATAYAYDIQLLKSTLRSLLEE